MNKNSLFTKAIAAFLAVLMVLGTLVSLRGFEVKAEAVVDNSAVRSDASHEGTKDGSVDYRVVSDSPTDIYEIPHSLRITKYYNTSNPYDYRQYEKFTVDWFESGKVAVHGHTTRNTYGYDMNVDGSNTRLYLAQDQYWEPGAKNEVGGNPIPYTAPKHKNIGEWKADEAINWIEKIGSQCPEYNLFVNKSTANKNFWLSGETGDSIWDKARMLVYMADPNNGEGASTLYDALYAYINGTIFPAMKGEVYNCDTNLLWYQTMNTNGREGTGALIRLGNDRYLGATVNKVSKNIWGNDWQEVLEVEWHENIDKNSAVYKEFVQLMVQHAIIALTTGSPFEGMWSWNMGMGPNGSLRVERARMTNVGTANQTTGENSGYVRMIVNHLLEMAGVEANRKLAENDSGFSFGYVMTDHDRNSVANPQDKYHYHGCFYGKPDYTVTAKATFEYYNNENPASTTFVRPGKVTAILSKTVAGTTTDIRTAELDLGNGWSYTFTGLPKSENGNTVTYSVRLAEAGGITLNNANYPWSDKAVRSNSNKTEFTIPLYPFTNVLLFKQWYKADGTTRVYPQPGNGDGLQPEAISFTVKNSANEALDPVATLYGGSNVPGATWKYNWARIPVTGVDANENPAFSISFPERGTDAWKNTWTAYKKDNDTDNRGVKAFFDRTNNVFNFEVYSKLNTSTTVKVNAVFEYSDSTTPASEVFVRPSTVKATLYKTVDGVKTAVGTVDLTSGNGWTYEWTNLPEYENGKQITYTVELAQNGIVLENNDYPWQDKTIRANGNEYTIPLYPLTNVFLFKQWYKEDGTTRVYPQPNNNDGLAPEYVQFTVTGKNGAPSGLNSVTLYGDSNVSGRDWQYKWTRVPVTGVGANGTPEYELTFTGRTGAWSSYKLNDKTNDRGIESDFNADNNEYYFYVYSKLDSKIEVIVNAVFEYSDTENAASTLFTRPSTVKATLYKTVNGVKTAIGTKELKAANGWGEVWQELAATEDGSEITYTVELAENGIVLANSNYKWNDKDVRAGGTDGAPVFTIPLYPKTNVHIFKRWYNATGSTQVYPQPGNSNGLDNEHVTFTINPAAANLQVTTLYDQANVPDRTWQYKWAEIDVIEPMMNEFGELALGVTHTGRSDKWINFSYKEGSDENGHKYYYNAATNTYHFEVNSKLNPSIDITVEAKFEYKDTRTTALDAFVRPAQVNASLYRTDAEGNKVFVDSVELTADCDWTKVFEKQPKYDPQGRIYTYSVELAADNGIDVQNVNFPWSDKAIRSTGTEDEPKFEIPLYPKTNVQVFKLWYDFKGSRVYPQPGNSNGLDNEHILFNVTAAGNVELSANLYDEANILNATWKYRWTEVDVTESMLNGNGTAPSFNMTHSGRSDIWEDYENHAGQSKETTDRVTDENGTISVFNSASNIFFFEVHSKLKDPGTVVIDKDAYLTKDGTYTMELYVWAKDNKVTLKDGNGNITRYMNSEVAIKDQLSDLFEFGSDAKVDIVLRKFEGYENGKAKFTVEDDMTNVKNDVKKNVKFDGNTVSLYGFDFNSYVCKTTKNGQNDEHSGYQLVVVISGILAKDSDKGFENELISSKAGVYINSSTQNIARVIDKDLSANQELKFPEKQVSIRYNYIVYDFGITMDVNFPEFFNQTSEDVEKVLSVDYMFPKQNPAAYNKVYPYPGARIITHDSVTGGSDTSYYAAGRFHHFKFGITEDTNGTHGFFNPNEISYRNWEASSLLKLKMENADAWADYSCNKNENPKYEWCAVEFVPATTVLYEADQNYREGSFVDENDNTVMVQRSDFADYTNSDFSKEGSDEGRWMVEGTAKENATQTHYNANYGFDTNYNNQYGCDSNGSAMMVTVTEDMYAAVRDNGKSWPFMKFTFTGTGFSFTTRCGIDTGVFLVDVVPAGQPKAYQSTDKTTYRHIIVNTRYYGGPNYLVGEENGLIVVNSDELLHQVPVIRVTDLAYDASNVYETGTYDVYITPVYSAAWANVPNHNKGVPTFDKVPGCEGISYEMIELFQQPEETKGYIHYSAFTSYVDTIRVYHPRGSHFDNETSIEKEAYYAAKELNCEFLEVRKLILEGLSAILNGNTNAGIGGAMFIDYGPKDANGNYINGSNFDPTKPATFTMDHYRYYGPNNELYLTKDGSYAFSLRNPEQVINLQLSMKAAGSEAAGKFEILFLAKDIASTEDIGKYVIESKQVEINSATEMYYDLTALANEAGVPIANVKAIAIKNASTDANTIISIMNIKIVHEKDFHGAVNPNDNILTTLETVEFANILGFGITGDVNGDRGVDMMDALTIVRNALGNNEFGISATFCGDVDLNGSIDMTDALSTMRIALND